MVRAEDVAPEAVGGEPREREVAGAEHLRQEVDGQPLEQRDREEEHHHGAVHREDLVVDLGVHEGRPGRGELGADHHGEDAAHQEEEHRGEEEHPPEVGVVHGGERALPARVGGPDRRQGAVAAERVHGVAPARNSVHFVLAKRADREAVAEVADPAELGADALVVARRVRLDPEHVRPPRNRVELAGKARHPEAVDDVERGQSPRPPAVPPG
jgi:hypothetical protein